MRLFYGNFDFERELGTAIGSNLPKRIRRLNLDLQCVMWLLADDGDLVWFDSYVNWYRDEMLATGLPEIQWNSWTSPTAQSLEFVPWGWTAKLRKWADIWVKRSGWHYRAPVQAAVRQANSRRFSFALEREWNIGLGRACEIRSPADLETAVATLPEGGARWVVKSEFGMSARERILGSGRIISQQSRNWIESRIGAGVALIFEPWVERVAEAGLQFTIPEAGEPILEGVTPLHCDANGQYRGSRFAEDRTLMDHWGEAIEFGTKAAVRAQQLGYFGPMGIDAMCYRDATGRERIRPLQDINARYTMGRLSLGLRRLLRSGEVGTWLHLRSTATTVSSARQWYQALEARLPAGVRLVRTSPLKVGELPPQITTLAVFAADPETLKECEVQLCSERASSGERGA